MDENIALCLRVYKRSTDFSDLTEKQNYKWINAYVAKYHKIIDVDEMVSFLNDAIDIQFRLKTRGTWLCGVR